MNPAVTAHIAIGSNLGERRAHVLGAFHSLNTLPGTTLVRASDLFETAAVMLPGDDAPQPNYLNAAAAIATALSPRELLNHLLAIECVAGRDRASEKRWGPRVLDLDLLLYASEVIDEPRLVVPHPMMHTRRFVLEPLASIAPNAHHPRLGRTIVELLTALPV